MEDSDKFFGRTTKVRFMKALNCLYVRGDYNTVLQASYALLVQITEDSGRPRCLSEVSHASQISQVHNDAVAGTVVPVEFSRIRYCTSQARSVNAKGNGHGANRARPHWVQTWIAPTSGYCSAGAERERGGGRARRAAHAQQPAAATRPCARVARHSGHHPRRPGRHWAGVGGVCAATHAPRLPGAHRAVLQSASL